ncbi:MAG: PEP-CTERM sorting domain-containing protein [Acidobacteriota bacterium]
MKKTLIALIGLMAASSAQASIIYLFQSVTPVGSSFDWKYTAQLSADQKINTAMSPAFAVIFDFLGATSVSTSNVVAGLTVNSLLENTSTEAFSQNVADSVTVPNVRTNLTGAFSAATNTILYTIDIISTSGMNSQTFVSQSAQALKNAPGDPANNSITGNTALIIGPSAAVSLTPEPATTALLGMGLLGLGLLKTRRLRS